MYLGLRFVLVVGVADGDDRMRRASAGLFIAILSGERIASETMNENGPAEIDGGGLRESP